MGQYFIIVSKPKTKVAPKLKLFMKQKSKTWPAEKLPTLENAKKKL